MDGPGYLFAYGSLVGRTSTEATLGRRLGPDEGPLVAYLDGYRRAWNVGSDRRSHPERTFLRDDDGSEYKGTVAVLGLERADGSRCLGAVIRIARDDIGPLAVRERNYELVDVTAQVSWPRKPHSSSVHTFVPSAAAVERRSNADQVVVNTHYVRQVEQAFGELGEGRLGEYRRSVAGELVSLRQLALRATSGDPGFTGRP